MDMLTRHGCDFDAVWETYYRQTFGPKGYNGNSLSTILREHERLKSRAEQIERLDREMQLHLVYYKEHYSFSEELDYRYALLQNRISLMRQENKELLKVTTLEIERYLRDRSVMRLEDDLYSPRLKTVHHHEPYDFDLDPGWSRTREAMSRVESGWLEPLLHTGTRNVHFHPQIIHHFHHYNTAENTKWISPRESVRFENAWCVPESDHEESLTPRGHSEIHEARKASRTTEPQIAQREINDESEGESEEDSGEENNDEFEEEIVEKQKNESTEKAVRFDPKPSVVVFHEPTSPKMESRQANVQKAAPPPPSLPTNEVRNDNEMYFRVISDETDQGHSPPLRQEPPPPSIQTKSPKKKDPKPKGQSAFRKVTPNKNSPRKADKAPKTDKHVPTETTQTNRNNQDPNYTTKSVSVLREEMGDKIIDGMKRNLHERLHNVRVGRPGSRIPIRSTNSEISEQIYGKYRNQRLYPEEEGSSVDGRSPRVRSSYDSPREERSQEARRGGSSSKQDRVANRRVKKLWYTEENRDKILKNVKQCIVKDIKFSIYSEYQKKPRKRINEW